MGVGGSKTKFDALKDSRTVMQIRDAKREGKDRNNSRSPDHYTPRAPYPPPQSAGKNRVPRIICTEP